MKKCLKGLFLFLMVFYDFFSLLQAQPSVPFTPVSLDDLSAFSNPGSNWVIASDASVDYLTRGAMTAVAGRGVLVNDFPEKGNGHLFTKAVLGDVEIELDFMMANYANSGVYLQGRYEIQLLDSWTRLPVSSSDCGGIYLRWKPGKGTFEGTPPVMNVAKAPGLWQHLYIRFKAPRFDGSGKKTANARFEAVYLNGVLVQQQADVTGPTASAMFPDEQKESPTGPLVLQGDHGKVAFRNIRYRALQPLPAAPPGDQYWIPKSAYWETTNPIHILPSGEPYLIRTFVEHGTEKLTHAVSVGYPDELNYGYDLKRGAVFQVWRGKFLDVTPAWQDRGGMQLGIPLGSVTPLSNAPVLALLESESAVWPDSIGFDELQSHGYRLNKTGSPTFSYIIKGLEVQDSINMLDHAAGIVRTITVNEVPANLFCRIAVERTITALSDELYVMGDKQYYIRIDKQYDAFIRETAGRKELMIRLQKNIPLRYRLVW